jgi:hypothetical protein
MEALLYLIMDLVAKFFATAIFFVLAFTIAGLFRNKTGTWLTMAFFVFLLCFGNICSVGILAALPDLLMTLFVATLTGLFSLRFWKPVAKIAPMAKVVPMAKVASPNQESDNGTP